MGKSSKRFGARYGSRIRKNVDEAESRDAECPECGSELERNAAGIWECTGCGNKIAGGAYQASTGAKDMLDRALQTDTEVEELEEAQEELGEA